MNSILNAIKKNYIIVFVVNMILSCLCYSLLMTNQLVNNLDGNWHGSISYANGHELSIGRWFWRYVDMARFHISPDPLTSFISLAIIAVAAILVLDVFDIDDILQGIVVSLFFTINTTVCAFLSYRYMSPTFALSVLFAIVSAYLIIKSKKLWICVLSALIIACMMGLYQAGIGSALLVILIYIPFRLYKDDISIKELLIYLLRAFVSFALGGALYVIILNLSFKYYNVTMDSYNGGNSYTLLGMIANFPARISYLYKTMFEYFANATIKITLLPSKIYYLVFAIIVLILILGSIKVFKKNIVNGIIFIVALLLVPAAANSVLLLAFDAFISIQMTFPMAMTIPVLLCLIFSFDYENMVIGVKPMKIAGIVIMLISMMVIYGNFYMVQYDEQAMYMGLQSTKTLTEEALSKMDSYNFLDPGYKYCFIGSPSNNPSFYRNDYFERANDLAKFGDFQSAPDCIRMNWIGFLNNTMGINLDIVDESIYQELISRDTMKAMPSFPAFGSVQLVDGGIVVVKYAEPEIYEAQ